MNLNHHPDDASLVSYASGGLNHAFAVLVGCHLERCAQCQQRVEQAEQLGGLLLEGLLPAGRSLSPAQLADAQAELQRRQAFMARLDEQMEAETGAPQLGTVQTDPRAASAGRPANTDISRRQPPLPAALQTLLQQGDSNLPWRRLVPGIQQIKLDSDEGNLRLLKIAPGMSIPLHTHRGSELTLVLEGSYSDELGRFSAGDVADLDGDVDHQPITDGNTDCICLIATDAPLRFRNFLPKLLQPFTGL